MEDGSRELKNDNHAKQFMAQIPFWYRPWNFILKKKSKKNNNNKIVRYKNRLQVS